MKELYQKVLAFLSGKKTYIGIVAGFVYSLLIYYGVVEANEVVWATIFAWTGVSYRAAITQK